MKKALILLAGCALLLSACSKDPGGVTNVTEDTAKDTTVETVVTEPIPLPDPVLTSFYELNGAHEEGSHNEYENTAFLEVDNRSRNELDYSLANSSLPYYVRVKQLPDGTYILLYNDQKNGKGVRSLTSTDGINWENYRTVFAPYDDIVYANPELIVLQNGELLCCSAWRNNNTWSTDIYASGIAIKRSTDNGKTWGPEKRVFLGLNWEPYLLQLKSGELQLYWTNTRYYRLKSANNSSTGTAILRSYDNGLTWTGKANVPYSGQVIVKQATEVIDGVQFYTDQMPVAVELQNGTIALILESRLNRTGSFGVTLAYSTDNWSETIADNAEGPADKLTNKFTGTGPYIGQFSSGEVLISYSQSEFVMRLADHTGRNFTRESVGLKNFLGWGGFEIINTEHTALAFNTAIYNRNKPNETRKIVTQKVNLNHAVTAGDASKITVDGNSADWTDIKEALFVGSETQAQASYRFAKDENRLCVLIDRLDYDITDGDTTTVRIALPQSTMSYLNVTVSPSGIVEQYTLIDGIKTEIRCNAKVTVFGTVNDASDKDEGYLAEIEIPMEYLGEELSVVPMLVNVDDKTAAREDSPNFMATTVSKRWIPIITK